MRNSVSDNGDGTSFIYVLRKNGDEFKVLVDTDKVPFLNDVSNTVLVDNFRGVYYAKTWLKTGSRDYLHRVLMSPPKGLVVDHINRDPLDNRLENLRNVTRAVNVRNAGTQGKGSSGYRWVNFEKHVGKYRARVTYNYTKYNASSCSLSKRIASSESHTQP